LLVALLVIALVLVKEVAQVPQVEQIRVTVAVVQKAAVMVEILLGLAVLV
jgi:hypothetical protein